MLTSEQFLKQLRSDLNHLYDPDHLRRSPLAVLFDVANRLDTPSRLRRILTEAIEALEPASDEPPLSPAWFVYEPLFYRYVQRLSQQQVADQLGICARHVRRKQRAALEVLADRLWKQFGLHTELREPTRGEDARTQAEDDSSGLDDELAWLKDAPPDVTTDLSQVLPTAVGRARPLAVRYDTQLQVALEDALPNLTTHPVAFTQTLLNLLGVAIHRAPKGDVRVSARLLGPAVQIQVRCSGAASLAQVATDSEADSIDMARRLTELCGGRLEISTDGYRKPFFATLFYPAQAQVSVLVIDDNVDTLRLFQRYVLDTRYHVTGSRNPETALDVAEKLSPQIIVLDVMMPQVDGWEVLVRVRQHPLTSHIPVIVCTILAQEELALSLGAHAFLHKPATRQDFLAILDQVMLTDLGSH